MLRIKRPRVLLHSLRSQVLATMLLAVFLSAGIYILISFVLATRSVRGVEEEQASRADTVSWSTLQRESATQRTLADEIARSFTVSNAVGQSKAAWLQSNVVARVKGIHGVTSVAMLDAGGRPLAGAGALLTSLGQGAAGVVTAAPGRQPQLSLLSDGRAYLVCAAPCLDARGRGVGEVVLAEVVNSDVLLALQRAAGASATALYFGSKAVAAIGWPTTVAKGPELSRADVTPSFMSTDRYLRVEVPLTGAPGQPRPRLALLLPRDAFRSVRTAMLSATVVAVPLAALAALCVGLVTSRGISRRLGGLVTGARAIAASGPAAARESTRDDEIDRVSTAFKEMSARVSREHDELMERIQALTTKLGDLAAVSASLTTGGDLRSRLEALSAQVRDVFQAEAAGLYLPDREASLLEFVSADEPTGEQTELYEVALLALATGRPATDSDGTGPRSATGAGGDYRVGRLMAVPLVSEGEVLGAIAAKAHGSFSDHDLLVLSAVAAQVTIAVRASEVVKRLESTNLETVRALAAAMETKDHYTAQHAESLALLAVAVGQHLGLTNGSLRTLEYAALLHDIGKIGVPGHILNKPAQLTDEEFAEMAKHTILGERISAQVDDLKPVAAVIRSAHERWDGAGYPDGLAGEHIPSLSRVLLACDAFDAMTSDRPYRPAMPAEQALGELRSGSGTQFDPTVVTALVEVWGRVARPHEDGHKPAMPIYIWRAPQRHRPEAQATSSV